MNPLWIILPLWTGACLFIAFMFFIVWWKNRPTFVTPSHGIKVYIKSEDIGLTPKEVDRFFDILVEHSIAFYKQYAPPEQLKVHDAPSGTVETVIRETVNGTFLYLDTKNITPPQWRKSYPRAKDKDGNLLPEGSNVNGLGYPGGVAIRLEDERDLKPDQLDYTLATSATIHEHMGHRCHRAMYGHDLRHSKDTDILAKQVWDAVRACKKAAAELGL